MQAFEVDAAASTAIARTPSRCRQVAFVAAPIFFVAALLGVCGLAGLFSAPDLGSRALIKSMQGTKDCEEAGEVVPGRFRPRCTDGHWASHQCDGSTGMCWCADKAGQLLEGTRGKPGKGPRHEDCETIRTLQESGNSTECHLSRLKAQLRPLLGAFKARCLPEGGYAPHQCWGSTGECWCTDATGKELNGTRGRPGSPAEDCASACGRCTAEHQQRGMNCVVGACLPEEAINF
ncbi:unnamed protein product [Symbiodinium sp. CCMP2456]|nr:unnamed protein product [Symbiodinium sp. CCMP2456]